MSADRMRLLRSRREEIVLRLNANAADLDAARRILLRHDLTRAGGAEATGVDELVVSGYAAEEEVPRLGDPERRRCLRPTRTEEER